MAVLQLTKENFKDTIVNNDFVIVDFWAPWCEPCVEFTPIFEAAAEKNPDIVFGMVNTEADPWFTNSFEFTQILGFHFVTEQPPIDAQFGVIGAMALDKIHEWAAEKDMPVVRDYYAHLAAKVQQK